VRALYLKHSLQRASVGDYEVTVASFYVHCTAAAGGGVRLEGVGVGLGRGIGVGKGMGIIVGIVVGIRVEKGVEIVVGKKIKEFERARNGRENEKERKGKLNSDKVRV
jgi:hypothetical protein